MRALIFFVSLGARALRADLVIENLALRQQVTALKRKRPRPPLDDVDRAFCVALSESWPTWASRLVIVKADTVGRRHRGSIPLVLGEHFPAAASGPSAYRHRDSPSHPNHGAGRFGRASYPC